MVRLFRHRQTKGAEQISQPKAVIANSLLYPDYAKCNGAMKIISLIEDQDLIRTILKHLGLWLVKSRPVPKVHAPPPIEYVMDDHSQISMSDDHLYRDPDYSWDAYIQS